MKFSISNIAWPKEWDEKLLIELGKLGFDAIEIAPNRTIEEGYESSESQIDSWNTFYLNQFNEISSMQSLLFKVNTPIFESNENMKYILEILKKGIIFASKLRVKTLVFGSPSIRNVYNNEQILRSKVFFKELANYATLYHIDIAIEPNPKIYNTNFLNSTKDAIDFVTDLNVPNLGVNLDFGTIIVNDEDIHDIITKDSLSRIKHVHISEPYLVKVDFSRKDDHLILLKKLVALNYREYISIEMKSGCSFEEIIEVLKYIKAIGIESGAFNEK